MDRNKMEKLKNGENNKPFLATFIVTTLYQGGIKYK